MKAIILAAGKSTRLLPLTKDTPQCLLKIGNKTFLEHQSELLHKANISKISVVTGYYSEQIENYFLNKSLQCLYNPFYEVSGTAMTLWVVKEELTDGFLLLYSDLLFSPDIIKGLISTEGDVVLAVKKTKPRYESEKIMEENGIVKSVSKDSTSIENGEFIGLAKFSARGAEKLLEVLTTLSRTDLNSSLIQTLNQLINNGTEVRSYDVKDMKILDVDFPEDFEKAKSFRVE